MPRKRKRLDESSPETTEGDMVATVATEEDMVVTVATEEDTAVVATAAVTEEDTAGVAMEAVTEGGMATITAVAMEVVMEQDTEVTEADMAATSMMLFRMGTSDILTA